MKKSLWIISAFAILCVTQMAALQEAYREALMESERARQEYSRALRWKSAVDDAYLRGVIAAVNGSAFERNNSIPKPEIDPRNWRQENVKPNGPIAGIHSAGSEGLPGPYKESSLRRENQDDKDGIYGYRILPGNDVVFVDQSGREAVPVLWREYSSKRSEPRSSDPN